MTNQSNIDRAEELRKYIKSKNMSRSGVERAMAVMLANIEGLPSEDERSYQTLYFMAKLPFEFVDLMVEVAKRNDEMDYEAIASEHE
jgi:hypothetical protein